MDLRTLRPEDGEQAWQLDRDAFRSPADARERYLRWFQPERMLGIFDGPRLVAMTGVHAFGQYFGGRSVPMGGVTAMSVTPGQRGRGHARRLLVAALEAMADRGEVFSSLYPATTSLYRGVGYELGGAHVIRRATPQTLRSLPAASGICIRPGAPEDYDAFGACYDQLAREQAGFVDYPARQWRIWRERPEVSTFLAEREDTGELTGFLVYRKFDGEFSHVGGDWGIGVDALIARDRDTQLALWGLLGGWGTQADQVIYRGPAQDPLLWLLGEQQLEVLAEVRWMSRVVDAAGAVAARGFPDAVEAQLELALRDPLLAHNDGRFRLSVSKGRGRLEPGGAGAIAMDVGAFSSLFTGDADAATLARAGRLDGGSPAERARLDAVFAGPAPWIPFEF